jgi:hypothetical protein
MANITPAWKHYRVIHSRFPPKNLFDSDDTKNLLLAELESMSSDRLHRWREFIKPEDFRRGDGWGPVMASFCYIRPGRFNSNNFGAYYCADSPRTAMAEWSYHSAKIWRDFGFTDEASAVVRCYTGFFKQPLIDLRKDLKAHNPDSYLYSQAKAQLHKINDDFGFIYHSVRHSGGLCAALLRPSATSPVSQSVHYSLMWDGQAFVAFAEISQYEKI